MAAKYEDRAPLAGDPASNVAKAGRLSSFEITPANCKIQDFEAWLWSRRCPVVDAELCRVWFRLRHLGVPLPAERGLVLFDGGSK